jgi:Sap, sulfolipid-1-addressing protein
MSFATILPLAFVMIAGPQIISSFFFATSKEWGRTSLAYVAGAAISITTFVSIAYFVGRGSKNAASEGSSTADTVLDWVILALIVALIAHVYATRRTSKPPKWMGKLQEASPRLALGLGLLLLGLFPTDILTSVAAGLHVARHDDPWWQCLPFVAVTLLLLGLPALTVAVLGSRAQNALPKIRDWMNQNSWVVSEIVLVFFAVITINSLVGD